MALYHKVFTFYTITWVNYDKYRDNIFWLLVVTSFLRQYWINIFIPISTIRLIKTLAPLSLASAFLVCYTSIPKGCLIFCHILERTINFYISSKRKLCYCDSRQPRYWLNHIWLLNQTASSTKLLQFRFYFDFKKYCHILPLYGQYFH